MRYAQVVIGPAGSGKVCIGIITSEKQKLKKRIFFAYSPLTARSCSGMLKTPNV